MRIKRLLAGLLTGSLSLLITSVFAKSPYNMPRGVTPVSNDVYDLHMTIFWICVVIAIVVFLAIIISLIRHRKAAGHKAVFFHKSTKVEVIWTVIPFLILVAIAIPSTIVMANMDNDANADMNIKITGHQWYWSYEYLDQGIKFDSNLSTPQAQLNNKAVKNKWYLLEVDHPLVVPVDKKIRFLVTSTDVIHSWWVPELAVKRDAIPGFIHESWAYIQKPGIYRGQCAELCGLKHGYMPIVVIAKTQKNFNAWVAKMKAKGDGVKKN